MRKRDIKPGQLYAVKNYVDPYSDIPIPCVIIDTEQKIRRSIRNGVKHTIDTGEPDVLDIFVEEIGYAVAVIKDDTPQNRAFALNLTIEDALALRATCFIDGIELILIRSFREVLGTYDQTLAKYELEKERYNRMMQTIRRNKMEARWRTLQNAFPRLGIGGVTFDLETEKCTLHIDALKHLVDMALRSSVVHQAE